MALPPTRITEPKQEIPPEKAVVRVEEILPTQLGSSEKPAPAAPSLSFVRKKLGIAPFEPDEGPKVDGYEIIRELGRGGMGVVYLAHQMGLDRFVALKMLLTGAHAGTEDRERFQMEAAAISRLQHPNLVQIFEVGEQDNHPYLSLEFVDGGNLDAKYNGVPQPPRQAAEMTIILARAIHFAHQKGIIHRDLKPANVLLMVDGSPKITDFGLAKRMDSDAGNTQSGAIMGTPSFMSPEQAAGRRHDIGPHTDVYALGAMLYEFLTGRPPFMAETGWDTIVQVISEEPVPPSVLQAKVPKDIETICLKCLQKDHRNRYASAADLADDLKRFLDHEPILARPIGLVERGIKWVKRRPASALALGMLILVVGGVFAVGTIYNRHLQQRAEDDRHRLVHLSVATGARYLEDGDNFGALVWYAEALKRDHDDPLRAEMHRIRLASLLRQSPKLVQLWFHGGGATFATFSPDGQRVVSASVDGVAQVWDAKTGKPIGAKLQHPGAVAQATFSPDGLQVLTACADGSARLWEVATGKQLNAPLRHGGHAMAYAFFSHDGRRILTSGGDNRACLWDAKTGAPIDPPLRHELPIHAAVFSPDDKTIVTSSDDKTAQLWDASNNQRIGEPLTHTDVVTYAVFSPDGQSVVTVSNDHSARLWNLSNQQSTLKATFHHEDRVNWAAFSPDGNLIVTAGNVTLAKVWNAHTGALVISGLKHGSNIRRWTSFSPNSRWVMTSSDDNTARVWDTQIGEPVVSKLIHNGTVHCANFSPDGHHIVTASDDNTVRVWDLASPGLLLSSTNEGIDNRARDILPAKAPKAATMLSPDGERRIVIDGMRARIQNVASGQPLTPYFKHEHNITFAAFSPDGELVVTTSTDQTAQLWAVKTGLAHGPALRHSSSVVHAAFSPDGLLLVTSSHDNTGRIWSVKTGESLAPPLRHDGSVIYAAFSPDQHGRWIVTVSEDRTARVWDAMSGSAVTPPLKHQGALRQAAFSADARQVVTYGKKREVNVWELPRDDRPWQELLELSQVLAGSWVTEGGEYVPLDLATYRKSWEIRQQKSPDDFSNSEKDLAAWRKRSEAEAVANRR